MRKRRALRVMELLDACAAEARALALVAADADASHDVRLTVACWRVEAAVRALTEAAPTGGGAPGAAAAAGTRPRPTGARCHRSAGAAEADAAAERAAEHPALRHLKALEQALVGLEDPLQRPVRLQPLAHP